jgi:hypothetical protein
MNPTYEAELRARWQAGDADAFDVLKAELAPGLLSDIRKLLDGDQAAANAAVEYAWRQAAKHPHACPAGVAFITWIYGVAKRRAILLFTGVLAPPSRRNSRQRVAA